jgi:hypothetical protein
LIDNKSHFAIHMSYVHDLVQILLFFLLML